MFNRNLWTPKNAENAGVYVQYDFQGNGKSELLNVSELEAVLTGGKSERGVRFSKDGRTAFAPYSTMNAGYHEKGALASNGFVLASYGIEGTEKLDNVAKTFSVNPYVSLVDNTGDKPIQSLSALGGDWGDDGGLGVDGGTGGSSSYGHAFGIEK